MHILHVLPDLSRGGAERQFAYLISKQVDIGHKVDVAFLSEGPDAPRLDGITTHKLFARSHYDPSLLWQLIRLTRELGPDIVHTWILIMDILGGSAARISGVPWILREPTSA